MRTGTAPYQVTRAAPGDPAATPGGLSPQLVQSQPVAQPGKFSGNLPGGSSLLMYIIGGCLQPNCVVCVHAVVITTLIGY